MPRRGTRKRGLRRSLRRVGRRTVSFWFGVLVGVAGMGAAVWAVRGQAPVLPGPPDPVKTPPRAYSWTEQPPPVFPIPPYARFLKGVSIVLDPGHVGQQDPGGTWKRGPTGLREAEVNLRVALFLREFLEAAEARVVLTREREESLNLPDDEDLRRRAAVANERHADLLLSIHHNADNDPRPNFTTLFYHAAPDQSAAGLCAARYLLAGLDDALRLDKQIECAVLSDRVLHKNGLAVLREAEVPAVLSEASFHSNPQEEARLRDPAYNRREAYGLFLGLARWAQAGLPRIALAQAGAARAGQDVVVTLDDGLGSRGGWGADATQISAAAVVVRLDGKPAHYTFDAGKRQVHVSLPKALHEGRHELFVDFENIFGQHVLHPALGVEVGKP